MCNHLTPMWVQLYICFIILFWSRCSHEASKIDCFIILFWNRCSHEASKIDCFIILFWNRCSHEASKIDCSRTKVVVEDIATATVIYLYYRTQQIVVRFQVAYGWILRWLARIRKLSIPLNCFIWPVLIRFRLIEIIRRNLGRLWPLFLRSLLGFTSKYWLSFTWTNVSPKALQKWWTDLDEIYNSLECKYTFSIHLRKVRINSTSVNFPQLGELVWSSNFFIQSKNLNFQCKTSVAV